MRVPSYLFERLLTSHYWFAKLMFKSNLYPFLFLNFREFQRSGKRAGEKMDCRRDAPAGRSRPPALPAAAAQPLLTAGGVPDLLQDPQALLPTGRAVLQAAAAGTLPLRPVAHHGERGHRGGSPEFYVWWAPPRVDWIYVWLNLSK